MKKITGSLLALILLNAMALGQNNGDVKKSSFAVHYFFHDFKSASNVRANNLGNVLNNRGFGKVRDMSPGLAFNYIRSVSKTVDASVT